MSRGLFLIADHQKKHAIKLAQELITAVLFACALQFAHLPAAWFFGPLVASAFFALRDWQAVELPRTVYVAAQAVIGCALGAGFSPATLLTLPKHFAIFAFAVVFILLTSLLNGWLLTRRTRLDVATAFLGTMPGGAGEMAAMGDSLRADSRLVVIMQYARLLLILAATPGGLDSVAAVAAELQGDTAVILTVQLVRLLCVLIIGPWLVRACSRWLGKRVSLDDPS
jgi:uncharacterized protein